jgi:putative ABC transport system permease protein
VSWPIVGVVQEMSPHLAVYAPPEAVREATGQPEGLTKSARVATRSRDAAGELAVARELQRTFERMGIEVTGMQRMLDQRQALLDHLVIVKSILAAASILVVFVGGLALALTLSLGVMQRTRELGILSAIGAAPRTLAFHVWFESVLIALLSWTVAVALAAPVSWLLEEVCGRMFFRMSLGFYLSPWAALIWLGLAVALATLSSLVPARRASRLTIREALAYE